MTRVEAIELLHDLIHCEVETTKKANSGNGRIPKSLLQEEQKLINRAFNGLCPDEQRLTESEYGDIIP